MNHNTRPDADAWPDAKKYPKSIRLHFSLSVAAIILVLMVTTSIIMTEKYTSVVTRAVVERLLAQARSYSGSASKHLLSADGVDALMLNNICRRLSDASDDIYWAAIADSKGELVAHTDVRQIASVGRLPLWNTAGESELLRPDEAFAVAADTVRIKVPIREHDLTVGTLELTASAEPIESARIQSLVTMASVTVTVLLIGLPLTMMLTHRKLRPISVITEHLQNTKSGDLNIDIPIKTHNEFGYLADTLRVLGQKVNEAQVQTVERERMAKELEVAREIQANILPKSYPKCTAFESSGFYQSAKEVGGDYFDFIELDSHRLGFLVADVSGKSLPGMLVMLLTRDIVRQMSRHTSDPAQLLGRVNRELRPNIKRGMFVTMFFGVLDRSTGRFDFASAGHNPLLYVSSKDRSVSQFRTKGFPLGLMPPEQFDKRIEVNSLALSPGDVLIQYSDGINEAQNTEGEEYGMDRFVSALEKNGQHSAEQIVESVMRIHNEFVNSAAQYDDITLVALKWNRIMTENCDKDHNADSDKTQHQIA